MLAIRHSWDTSLTTKPEILPCAPFDPFMTCFCRKEYKRTACSLGSSSLPLKGTICPRSSSSSNALSQESLEMIDGFRKNALLTAYLVNGRIIELSNLA